MKKLLLSALLVAAACSAPPVAQRSRPVPPGPPPAAARQASPQVFPTTAITEEATRAWLDQAIERAPKVEPPEPMVQVVERVVEKPVVVRAPYDPYWYQYDYGGYYAPRSRNYRRHNTFPLGTALGAGIGAVIGHQSGHRGRGAWIGGSVGLLFDAANSF